MRLVENFRRRYNVRRGPDDCCSFTGDHADLVLGHDHDTMQLRGWLNQKVNCVLDKVLDMEDAVHINCYRNLCDSKMSFKIDSEAGDFQRWLPELIHRNPWLLTDEKYRQQGRAEATRQAYRQVYHRDLQEPAHIDEHILRRQQVDWPQFQWIAQAQGAEPGEKIDVAAVIDAALADIAEADF